MEGVLQETEGDGIKDGMISFQKAGEILFSQTQKKMIKVYLKVKEDIE